MGNLSAAANEIDITPPVGTWMTGYGARVEPSKGVHDPIMARALLLDDGTTGLAIVSCDVLGFEVSSVEKIRRLVSVKDDKLRNVMVCCTHTHTGPSAMHMRGGMGHVNEEWLAETEVRIAELVAGLPSKLQAARIAYASRIVPGIGYNRQDPSRGIDDELGFLGVDGIDGHPIATVMNYATHAVVLGTKLDFSGDFPGAAARHLARIRGGVGLYLQGASGDAEPVVQRERGWGKGTFDDAKGVGEQLADKAVEILGQAQATDEVTIRVARKLIDIPLDPPPSREEVAGIRAGLEKERETALTEQDHVAEQIALAMIEWAVDLGSALENDAVPKSLQSEMLVIGINDLRIIAMPFEVYSGIGLDIKRKLKPLKTVFLGYVNGLIGYLPTAWAKEQGGYGPNDSCRWFPSLLTPVSSRAHELVISEAVTLAKSL